MLDMKDRSVPEEIIPTTFSCVGMIIVNWTFVENALDAWTAIAFHEHNASSIERQLPKMFGRKVKFLKKCFRRLPGLAPFSDEAIAFIERANELSEIRHYVAHGTLSHFDTTDESFIFAKIGLSDDKQQHEFGELRILGTDLLTAGTKLTDMARQGQKLTYHIMKASGR